MTATQHDRSEWIAQLPRLAAVHHDRRRMSHWRSCLSRQSAWRRGGGAITLCMVTACGSDIRDGNIHQCHVTYNPNWSGTDLTFDHTEPRLCPYTLVTRGQDEYASGHAEDPDDEDVRPGSAITLSVYSADGFRVGYDAETWFQMNPWTRVATLSTYYDAGMGNGFEDRAVIETYINNRGYAMATIYLPYRFGA